jgi:hypothetical protein
MSTSLESIRVADRIVTAISRWLAHHSSDDELRHELEVIDLVELTPTQAEAVLELQNELEVNTERPAVEMIAREALEAIAVAD